MKRRKNKGKKPAAAISTSSSSAADVYGDKKVLLGEANTQKPVSWMKIDPHYTTGGNAGVEIDDCFAVTRTPGTMNSQDLEGVVDVYKIMVRDTPVFNNQVYFVGGRYLDYDELLFYGKNSSDCYKPDLTIDYKSYSDKVITYDLSCGEYKELSPKLNIARGLASVVIVAGVAYVFGGNRVDYHTLNSLIEDKNYWIECLNLLDEGTNNNDNNKWEFLPLASAPPEAVFKDYFPMYTFVYELGNVIVFVMPNIGCYAFNYVSKTWAPFLSKINKYVQSRFFKVAVMDHLLFWRSGDIIHAYDLKNDQLVYSKPWTQFHQTDSSLWRYSFMERVGNDTLLLILRDCSYFGGRKDELHFYKFKVQNYSRKGSPYNLFLNQIGHGRFHSTGYQTHNVVAV